MASSDLPVIWITGCANGVGAQLVTEGLHRNFLIIATDIDLKTLEMRAGQMMWPEDKVLLCRLDVRSENDWQRVYDQMMQRWCRLDVLINNAGVIQPGFLRDISGNDLDLHLDVNLKGVIHGSQLAMRHMLKIDSGHIINIASLAGIAPVPGLGLYSVSKFGVRAYSLVLAQELAETGINVTVLCPDLIKTSMYDLQLDYPEEAALTFSGGEPLSVEQIALTVYQRILTHAPMEVTMPACRGWLAKLANLIPQVTKLISRPLRNKGRERILMSRERN
ncbi:SDR family oxidoreductase [Hahella ganghwensis]|uniref:SDR family oxidoreductase n=1 Tax=Hahella ganghwensis TaxID=286420 RepID=UPI00036D6D51|nr:SDR family oxidoreductase [Hahella ganghwensis]